MGLQPLLKSTQRRGRFDRVRQTVPQPRACDGECAVAIAGPSARDVQAPRVRRTKPQRRCRHRWTSERREVVGTRCGKALVHDHRHFIYDSQMDREPVPLTQQWRHVIESGSTGDKSNSRILNGLNAVQIAVRQTDEGGITIVQSHEDETRDQHDERRA